MSPNIYLIQSSAQSIFATIESLNPYEEGFIECTSWLFIMAAAAAAEGVTDSSLAGFFGRAKQVQVLCATNYAAPLKDVRYAIKHEGRRSEKVQKGSLTIFVGSSKNSRIARKIFCI